MRKALLVMLPLCAMAALLAGCSTDDIVTFHSKGQVGVDERNLIILAFALMLLVVVPAILMTFWFGWKYRESNAGAEYLPEWSHSTKIEVVVWGVPCLIIAALAVVTYITCFSLDPYKKLASDQAPVDIQVISQPFKWVFIYPEDGIATVNEVHLPVNRPVTFHITSDFSMNSFAIPQLGGMIYAMAGMHTQLNLIANEAGVYNGLSTNYSGNGFSRMRFKAYAESDADYKAWIQKVKSSKGKVLDRTAYEGLRDYSLQGIEASKAAHYEDPLDSDPVQYFSSVQPGLFQAVIDKYMDGYRTAEEIAAHKQNPMEHMGHMDMGGMEMNAPAHAAGGHE